MYVDHYNTYFWKKRQLLKNEEVFFDGDIRRIVVGYGIILVVDSDKNLTRIKANEKRKYEGIKGLDVIIDENNIIRSIWNKDYTKSFKLRINLKESIEVWKTESYFGNPIIIDNDLYGIYPQNIYHIDVEDGQPLWNSDISQFGTYNNFWKEEKQVEVKQIVGKWKEQLIVQLNNGTFIGIESKNGNLLWSKNNVDNNFTGQQLSNGFGQPDYPFIDEDKGVVYILQGELFIKLDIENQKASYEWSSVDDNPEQYFFIKDSRKVGDKIYFTASLHPGSSLVNQIGVFDINLKKVIWQYELELDKGVFIRASQNNIQVDINHLYILDSSATLHVFEREEYSKINPPKT